MFGVHWGPGPALPYRCTAGSTGESSGGRPAHWAVHIDQPGLVPVCQDPDHLSDIRLLLFVRLLDAIDTWLKAIARIPKITPCFAAATVPECQISLPSYCRG